MILKHFVDEGLAHVSYIVGCEKSKEVCIIDPKRDIGDYVEYINQYGLIPKYILNTHPHADFVGGHAALAESTGAKNVYAHNVSAEFETIKAKEGAELPVGSLNFKVLETPGHTPFCLSFLLQEEGVEKIVFTGDFLFIGDIGRPDLLGEELKEQLLEQSYQSAVKLHGLSDDIIVLPSHMGGTFCGKDLKSHFMSTVGIEKKTNQSFALAAQNEQKYKNNLDAMVIETPEHFKKMSLVNLQGPAKIPSANSINLLDPALVAKDPQKYTIIDLRDPYSFATAHIKGSINIYYNANISLIAGSLLDQEKEYVLLLPRVEHKNQMLKEVQIKLARVGIDRITHIINTDINAWVKAGFPVESLNIVKKEMIDDNMVFISFAKNCQTEGERHIRLGLSAIKDYAFDRTKPYTFECEFGFKSIAAISYLNSVQKQENIYYTI